MPLRRPREVIAWNWLRLISAPLFVSLCSGGNDPISWNLVYQQYTPLVVDSPRWESGQKPLSQGQGAGFRSLRSDYIRDFDASALHRSQANPPGAYSLTIR